LVEGEVEAAVCVAGGELPGAVGGVGGQGHEVAYVDAGGTWWSQSLDGCRDPR
jgi:hypothetical protein